MALGLYGVVTGSVTERVREIGRTALGASPSDVVGPRVVRHAQTLTLTGAALGWWAGTPGAG